MVLIKEAVDKFVTISSPRDLAADKIEKRILEILFASFFFVPATRNRQILSGLSDKLARI